ncbi:MAG: hypothetical protein ACQKBU_01790, partial [Verrucomicrobiales bacterium]
TDSLTFASKRFFGDGALIAQLDSMSDVEANGFGGIMVRESSAEDSPFLLIGLQPGGELICTVRLAEEESAKTTYSGSRMSAPIFFKIARKDNLVTPSYSTDGLAWTDLDAVEVSFALELQGGLVAASGDNSTRGTVTFREWENRDIAAYPAKAREIDGLSAYLAYGLGVDAEQSAFSALPRIQSVADDGALFPEMVFNRRVGFPESKFVIRSLGHDMTMWADDTSGWQTRSAISNPDGVSESVRMRRNMQIGREGSAFYALEILE